MVDHRKDQSRPVLREAQLAREGRLQTQHAPFAEHVCRVPLEHLSRWHQIGGVWRPPLNQLFPGMNSKDHAENEEATKRFLESPIADVYRVRKRRAQLGHL